MNAGGGTSSRENAEKHLNSPKLLKFARFFLLLMTPVEPFTSFAASNSRDENYLSFLKARNKLTA